MITFDSASLKTNFTAYLFGNFNSFAYNILCVKITNDLIRLWLFLGFYAIIGCLTTQLIQFNGAIPLWIQFDEYLGKTIRLIICQWNQSNNDLRTGHSKSKVELRQSMFVIG